MDAERQNGDRNMAIDGTWNLVVKTPMGEQESTLVISSSGATARWR
jgi:hypothetical protein